MLTSLIRAGAIGLTAIAFAKTSTSLELHLLGGRFKPLTYRAMCSEQRTMADHVLKGERGSMNGPYNVLLRSPEMGGMAQKYGAYLRFHSSVPKKLNELAILITARHWNSQYEWYAHRRYGLAAGLRADLIEALAGEVPPRFMAPLRGDHLHLLH